MFIWIEHVAARGAPTIPARHKNRAGTMATMHLTNNEANPYSCAVASDFSEAAGAPEHEIELTPEMIHAGVCVILAMDTRFESHEDVVEELIVELFKNNPRGSAYHLKFL
jgi:hypothetical protein